MKLHAFFHFVENWPILYFFQTNIKTWVFDLNSWKVRVEDSNTLVTCTQKLRKKHLAKPIWFGDQSVIVRNTKSELSFFNLFCFCENHDKFTFWDSKVYRGTNHHSVDLDSPRQLHRSIAPISKIGQS